jgi:hypothetical protein
MKTLFKTIAVCAAMVLVFISSASAQQLMGLVIQKNQEGMDEAVPGANVFWLGTTTGVTTGSNGIFMISRVPGNDKLVVSFTGFVSDTLTIANQTNVKVELKSLRT